ncbi:MAG TPA: hormogonium polysaccharide biosynthesis glycosyltransferase HpsE [Elainellaceae cyanobacterium]|jgi:glycosyltransferase involved in cell wall biosynthesis
MVDFTVAIPTYNGEFRLPEVLNQLCKQIGTESFSWEVVIVDNNSSDRTASVIQRYQQFSRVPIHYCFEPDQGAAYARSRAVREAHGNLVGFLDDDNIPSCNWVSEAYAFGQQHPNAGAYGSQIHGEYEVTPPKHFERIAPFLAITQRGSKPLLYVPSRKILPPSAGLVVRRQVWLDHVPTQPILVGRLADNPLAGEDLEMISYIQRSEWEVWYNPLMEIVHKIPQQRLEKHYLISLFRGMGLSRHVTRMLNVKPWQRPFAFLAYLLNDTRKIVIHLIKHRIRAKTDVVAACELEFFWSSLISPFYLWKGGYLKPSKKPFTTHQESNPVQSQIL